MSDILRQVDEDLRKEKLSNLWNKYGIYTTLFLIFVIVLIIGLQFKASYDKSRDEKLVELYIDASNSENINQQLSLFEEVVDSKNNYIAGLAAIKVSNLQIENGNIVDGISKLEEITQNKEYNPIIRDLAVYLLLINQIEDPNNEYFLSYLTNERIDKSFFKYLFLEIIAVRKLIFDNFEEANKDFENLISNQDLPIDIRNRAIKFLELIN